MPMLVLALSFRTLWDDRSGPLLVKLRPIGRGREGGQQECGEEDR